MRHTVRVVLDVRTGKLPWHKQAVPHDSHDWDMPLTSPLFQRDACGKERKVARMATKDGLLRLIDRDSREQIYSVAVATRTNADQPDSRRRSRAR